ncbi:MAG: PKD domain-containing protein [Lishizhenia sp.]
MIKWMFSLLTILILSIGSAQDSSSVLFLGNSYTAYNNLPQMFKSITESLGDAVTVDSRTPGGTTFQGHATNTATYQKIQSNPWHFVVLQAQSQEPSFPDSQVNSNTLPYAQQIADSVYSSNFCTQILYYMTWGRKNGDAQWAPISTYEGMQNRLRNAYVRFADSTQGSVSPVGMAWKYIRETQPSIELYTADESHPSYAGTYLAACTFYAAVFRKSPVGATFIGSLSAQDAGFLQEAAALTVLNSDSLSTFYLRENPTVANFDILGITPQVEIENRSWRATDYLFDFGDGFTSVLENPTHIYTNSGNYTIELEASSSCNTNSLEKETNITVGVVNPTHQFLIKTLANNQYKVEAKTSIGEWKIINQMGQALLEGNTFEKSLKLDLSLFKNGVYTLVCAEGDYKLIRK